MSSFFQNPGHMMAHDSRLRMRHHDRSTQLFHQQREILRSPGIGGSKRLRIAGLTSGSRQRGLRVGDQLLVVLESVIVVGSRRRRTDRSSARNDTRIHGAQRISRAVIIAMERGVGMRVAWLSVPYKGAGENSRPRRNQMAEPIGPGAVVADPAEGRDLRQALGGVAASDGRGSLMNHGLIEAGPPAPGLVYQIHGHALPDEIR